MFLVFVILFFITTEVARKKIWPFSGIRSKLCKGTPMEGEGHGGWVCSSCTFMSDVLHRSCSMCGSPRPREADSALIHVRRSRSTDIIQMSQFSFSLCRSLPRVLAGAISGALTGMFAIVGAFTGAVTGALAGRATNSGFLRGAGLGAVAGAVLSVEVLEASRAYWYSEHSGSLTPSSMAEFIEDLLNGRFMQEQMAPAMFTPHRWQVNMAEMSYEELYDMFGPRESRAKGASEALLEKLPCHTITKENRVDSSGDVICCAICLQELQQGDTARSLPSCHHVFHLYCVDKWLARHVSCPVCRHEV